MNSLSMNYIQKEKQKIQLINQLSCMIRQGKDLILPHTDNIATILLKHLKESLDGNILIPHILDALSELCIQVESKMIKYHDEIIPILLSAMQDKSSTRKRESAVKTFINAVKNTGFVILPFYKYPTLLESLLNFIGIEAKPSIKYELLRLIGCLGAIDYFMYKKVITRMRDSLGYHNHVFTFDDIKNHGLKYPFKFFNKKREAYLKSIDKDLLDELNEFYDDLVVFGNFNDQKTMILHLANINKKSNNYQMEGRTTTYKFIKPDSNKGQITIDPEINELINTQNEISLNNFDYYYTVTIKTLLKILCDPSLQTHHDLAAGTLKLILEYLKGRCSHFLHILIPVFINIISIWEVNFKDKSENLLKLIERIIRHCEKGFHIEYIDKVLGIFLKYVMESRLTFISLDILNTLISIRKSHLKYKLEPVIKNLNIIISEDKEWTKKIINIYKNLDEYLDPYLFSVIPLLCKILNKESSLTDFEILKDIIMLFTSLASSCPSTVQYLSLMVHNLIHLIEQTPNFANAAANLQTSIMNCFFVFIYKYRF